MTFVKKFIRGEEGISSVEYALLVALIAAGIAIAAQALGQAVQARIAAATAEVNT